MSNSVRPDDADQLLIDELLDAAITESSPAIDGLLALLETDAEACEYLLDRAVLHAGLRQSLRRRSLGDWAVSRAH